MVSSFVTPRRPDWFAAAGELADGLVSLSDARERVRLLDELCVAIGPRLYPAFLHLLHTLARHAEPDVQAVVAATLVDGLRSGRLPSGPLSAWGLDALDLDGAFGQRRSLGPVEYLCVWFAQPSGQPPLSEARFSEALSAVTGLIAADPRATDFYARHIRAVADDPLGGSLAAGTRVALTRLADAWQAGAAPGELARCVAEGLREDHSLASIAVRPPGI